MSGLWARHIWFCSLESGGLDWICTVEEGFLGIGHVRSRVRICPDFLSESGHFGRTCPEYPRKLAWKFGFEPFHITNALNVPLLIVQHA
jgi:hypothetical protein